MDLTTLLDSLQVNTDIFTVQDVSLTILLSFVLALVIGWTYRYTYRGTSYSQSYVQTLVLMAMGVAGLGAGRRFRRMN